MLYCVVNCKLYWLFSYDNTHRFNRTKYILWFECWYGYLHIWYFMKKSFGGVTFNNFFYNFSTANSHTPEPRSWFGPNGQYIRELPCPSCRGRGYTPCTGTECGIERSRPDCQKCYGNVLSFGIVVCYWVKKNHNLLLG